MNSPFARFASAFLLLALVACSERPPGDDDALVAPTNVTATAKAGSIVVNWSDNSTGELGFRVFRQTYSADDDTVLATNQVGETAANATEFVDTDVSSANRYSYLVAAFTATGMSDRTAQQGEPVSPEPGDVQLEVTLSGAGEGTVTSDPAGISCGADCSAEFAGGTTVTLSATAEDGAEFVGWTGDCSGSTATCEVVMDADKTVGATFSPVEPDPPSDEPIVVNSAEGTSGGPDCTLRDAIEAANTDAEVGGCSAGDGADVIEIAIPEPKTISLDTSVDLSDGANALPSITSHITIQGDDSIIERAEAGAAMRLFHVGSGGHLLLHDTTVRNGDGGAEGGGGFYVSGGTLEVFDGMISDHANGAITVEDGDLELDRVTIADNAAPVEGTVHVAGIHVIGEGSAVDIANTTIEENDGLAVRNSGELSLTSVDVRNNTQAEGGGGFVNLETGTVIFDGVDYTEHTAAETGGAVINEGTFTISNSTLSNNSGGMVGRAGAVWNKGAMEIFDTAIKNNVSSGDPDSAGAIFNEGTLLIDGGTLTDNESQQDAGAIWNEGTLTLVDTSVENNTALLFGGGILNRGALTLQGSTTIGGEVGNGAEQGGGIYYGPATGAEEVPLSLTMEGASSIAGNQATGDGGGVYVAGSLTLAICEACSITGNVADTDTTGDGTGGGVYGAEVTIDNPERVFDNLPDDIAPVATP